MYHSCRIWEDMYPGRLHGIGCCRYRSNGQKKQNHDSLWLLPFAQFVLVQFPGIVQTWEKTSINITLKLIIVQNKSYEWTPWNIIRAITSALCFRSKLVSTLSRIPEVLLVSFCRELTWKNCQKLLKGKKGLKIIIDSTCSIKSSYSEKILIKNPNRNGT